MHKMSLLSFLHQYIYTKKVNWTAEEVLTFSRKSNIIVKIVIQEDIFWTKLKVIILLFSDLKIKETRNRMEWELPFVFNQTYIT